MILALTLVQECQCDSHGHHEATTGWCFQHVLGIRLLRWGRGGDQGVCVYVFTCVCVCVCVCACAWYAGRGVVCVSSVHVHYSVHPSLPKIGVFSDRLGGYCVCKQCVFWTVYPSLPKIGLFSDCLAQCLLWLFSDCWHTQHSCYDSLPVSYCSPVWLQQCSRCSESGGLLWLLSHPRASRGECTPLQTHSSMHALLTTCVKIGRVCSSGEEGTGGTWGSVLLQTTQLPSQT